MTAITRNGFQSLIIAEIVCAKTQTKNVRNLYETGQLAQLYTEFQQYQLAAVGIGEVRWTGNDKTYSEKFTILYYGHVDKHVQREDIVLSKEPIENSSVIILGMNT